MSFSSALRKPKSDTLPSATADGQARDWGSKWQSSTNRAVPFQKVGRMQVLVVEDCISSRLMLCYMLDSIGLNVTSCMSAEEALELCETHKFDLIFMDIGLPGMSGIEAINEIKGGHTANRLAKVIICSGYNPKEHELTHRRAGFLKKPIDKTSIKNKIQELTSFQNQLAVCV